jgi:SPOR domain
VSDEVSIPRAPSYRVPLRPRRRHDPATRMRLMVAGGLAAVVVAWFAGSTLFGGGRGQVPIVQAESGPMRVKPADPGGLQVPGADNAIFSANGGDGADKLAPPPQTPDLQALRAPPRPAPTPTPAEPSELAAAAPPPPPVAHTAETPKPPGAVAASNPVPAANSLTPAVVAADRRPSPPAIGASHGTLVQLAALSSEQAAREEWGLLAKRMPQLLSGKQPSVSKVEHDGRTYWRLRTGGFADMAQATTFCMRMRAKGASCSVADF